VYIISESPSLRAVPVKLKEQKSGNLRAKVCLQTSDDVNRNNRKYSFNLLKDGIQSVDPRIKDGSFMGELDHPISDSPVRQVTVLYKEASHRILETGWDGNKLVGVIETLRTPNGEILKNLIEDGIPVGFSLRGMGELKQVSESGGKSYMEVTGPLHIISYDSVSYPSHQEAKLIRVNESVIKKIYKETGLSEVCDCDENKNLVEGMVCNDNGYCYFPASKESLVENRVNELKGKFLL